jgi:hypothetical protein
LSATAGRATLQVMMRGLPQRAASWESAVQARPGLDLLAAADLCAGLSHHDPGEAEPVLGGCG